MIDLTTMTPSIALGPLDGRYRADTEALVNYLSEPALQRARLRVEVEWMIFLSDRKILAEPLDSEEKSYLRALPENFGAVDLEQLKTIESETRHDVKAVEYFIDAALDAAEEVLGRTTTLSGLKSLTHIFATSEDISSLAYGITVRDAIHEVWLPAAESVRNLVAQMAREYRDIPMLSHTHGQPASPTTVGKELAVFAHRLSRQIARVASEKTYAKFSGATGTFAAHAVAQPKQDWPALSREFVESFGVAWNPLTTQIEPMDWFADIAADIAHVNRIAHNLATDMWMYISLGYFHQDLSKQGSTGSSTMPHKVNPIRFENAEANFEISLALLDNLADTLVTSRMQRDLTDSTTKRNISVALGHSLLALKNLHRGLDGVTPERGRLAADLDGEWELLAEPIQQVMRAADLEGTPGMENPYERLKNLTRGKRVTEEEMREFISSLGLPKKMEKRLLALTPETYVGVAAELVDFLDEDHDIAEAHGTK